MSRLRRPPPWGVILLWLVLCACWGGCSRPVADQSPDAGAHPLPFREGGTTADPTAVTPPTSLHEGKDPTSGIPFHDPQSLPVGTLLTVLLKQAISSDNLATRSSFVAAVDEPVVIQGKPLIPRGAPVVGRVESAGSVSGKPNRSYFRLTLESVEIGGQDLSLHTASLFARGDLIATQSHTAASVRLEEGRRLTFRLTEPAYVVSQPAISRR